MNKIKKFLFAASIIAFFVVQSCNTTPKPTAYTPSLQDAAQVFNVGKTVFNVVIKDQNGKATPGLTVEVDPEMDMGGGMAHNTPVESVRDNGDGSYAVTAYFLMAGTWALHFHVNAEHLADHIAITVSGTMMDRGRLDGVADMSKYWMASHNRPYNIFKSALTLGGPGADSIDLYLTTWESELIQPALYQGQILHTDSMMAGTAWNVGTVTLSVCNAWNGTSCTGWSNLTDQGNGHFTGSSLTIANTGSMTPAFAVHLNVANASAVTNEWKTTTGTAAATNPGTGDGTGDNVTTGTEFVHINQ